MLENPKLTPQEAINHAAFAKNCEVNQTRFSPLQLMSGQTPHFPGLVDVNPASLSCDSSSKFLKALKTIDSARVKFREVDCDMKLKQVMTERINPNVERRYDIGDPVFFYDPKNKHWKKGTALIRLGKILYLRFGNFLRRVPIERVRPDYDGQVHQEESYADCDETDTFEKDGEIDMKDMSEDLELADEVLKLRKEVEGLEVENSELKENITAEISEEEMYVDKEEIQKLRRSNKKTKKEKKKEASVNMPKTHDVINFKLKNKD